MASSCRRGTRPPQGQSMCPPPTPPPLGCPCFSLYRSSLSPSFLSHSAPPPPPSSAPPLLLTLSPSPWSLTVHLLEAPHLDQRRPPLRGLLRHPLPPRRRRLRRRVQARRLLVRQVGRPAPRLLMHGPYGLMVGRPAPRLLMHGPYGLMVLWSYGGPARPPTADTRTREAAQVPVCLVAWP